MPRNQPESSDEVRNCVVSAAIKELNQRVVHRTVHTTGGFHDGIADKAVAWTADACTWGNNSENTEHRSLPSPASLIIIDTVKQAPL